MQIRHIYHVLLLAFGTIILLYSCANIHSLEGGLKDVSPPRDSIYIPENFSVNFNVKEFSIKFDEYINLNDITNELIVSPPLEKKPIVVAKKKTVYVSFEDDLIPNTTYTFNFGEAIVDYTEGNAAKNLSYVFSTGPELDSLSVSGKCIDSYTNQPIEGAKVMLYNSDEDSLPLTEKPFYFGTTNKSGNFNIEYLKPGDYKIFCLQDENRNYLYDEDEIMGFKDSLITSSLKDSLQIKHSILMSKAIPSLQTITDYSSDSTGFAVFSLAKKSDSITYEVLDLLNPKYYTEQDDDSTYFWITSSELKNQIFKLEVSDRSEVIDTLYLLYYPDEEKKIDWKKPKGIPAISMDSNFVFQSDYTMIESIDQSFFSLIIDSINKPFEANVSEISKRSISINSNFEESKKYSLTVLPGGITSINGTINDTLNLKFKTNSKSTYGKIIIDLIIKNPKNYLVQLIDDNEKIYFQSSISSSKTIEVSQLLAKKYTLRMIKDVNMNNKWDPGNYLSKFQPEEILYYPEKIEVKPNWELEYGWEIK